jgi:hypothetical protein
MQGVDIICMAVRGSKGTGGLRTANTLGYDRFGVFKCGPEDTTED